MNIVDEYLLFCMLVEKNKLSPIRSRLTKQRLRMFHKWHKQWQRTLKEIGEWGA